jgi:hypothetical protein
VKKLDAEGRLIPALKDQVKIEGKVLAETPHMTHLARHEINQMYEIDQAPPM